MREEKTREGNERENGKMMINEDYANIQQEGGRRMCRKKICKMKEAYIYGKGEEKTVKVEREEGRWEI